MEYFPFPEILDRQDFKEFAKEVDIWMLGKSLDRIFNSFSLKKESSSEVREVMSNAIESMVCEAEERISAEGAKDLMWALS